MQTSLRELQQSVAAAKAAAETLTPALNAHTASLANTVTTATGALSNQITVRGANGLPWKDLD
jgi:hypothetical protein